ncbi:MAG TPA: NAD(P)H-quinone oxidoreductase [Steroidobacteraceae bacterium]|jgi:putative PIG3 family NAD(P)H quinone oxidoreductase|nr:NAD(P)H-quinone oxidoreductase [Steroidobacteraceae bacterium]
MTSMTAIGIRAPGPPEVLQPIERPIPDIGPDDVLIRVAAAGVNRPDVMQRKGLYPPPAGASDIPGLEVAGEVVKVGANVRDPAPGARVCALVTGGGYAQFVAAPAVQCLPVPDNVTVEEAAAIPETFFTVFLNVFQRVGLRSGETLLIHGGSSGIGTTAIMLAKAFDARVIVTAGTAEKCAACVALGADQAINYKAEDFVAATQAATQGRGADVILDMVGGEYLPRNIAAAALEGRIAIIAHLGGSRAELDIRAVMIKRLTLSGSTLRAQPVANKGRIAAALRSQVWPLFASKRLRPLIHARFPLAEAARAHALMESGEHVGKIILLS